MSLQRSIAATSTPVRIAADGDMRVLIQNIGAGIVYIGPDSDVNASNGIMVSPGGWYESSEKMVSSRNHLWLMSPTTADVRVMRVG